MKKLVMMCGLVIIMISLKAQSDYKVAFDLTSGDTLDQKALMRWLTAIATGSPHAKMEVIMYSKGIYMVKAGGVMEEPVKRAMQNQNVSFKVCGVALKNLGVTTSQLISGVQVVDDGVYELVKRQQEGWGYIKAVQ